jgi:hypothetical protein
VKPFISGTKAHVVALADDHICRDREAIAEVLA